MEWNRNLGLGALFGLVTLGPFLLFGLVSVLVFETGLTPLYHKQTEVAAQSVQRKLEFGIRMFGGIAQLRDVNAVLEETRQSSADLAFLAVTDANGSLLFSASGGNLSGQETQSLLRRALRARDTGILTQVATVLDQGYSITFGQSMLSAAPDRTRRVGNYVITSVPLTSAEDRLGAVHVAVDVSLFDRIRLEVGLDALAILLAAALIGYELMRLIFSVHISRPRAVLTFVADRLAVNDLRFVPRIDSHSSIAALARAVNFRIHWLVLRAQDLGGRSVSGAQRILLPADGKKPLAVTLAAPDYIRLPLFLFFLSETVLRPFLPLFLGGLDSGPGLQSPESQVGAAMSAFMAASIVGVYVGSILCDRVALKRVFTAGVVLTAISMVAHAYVTGAWHAIAARTGSGIGYGLVYAAGQMYVTLHASTAKRTTGFSLFLSVVVAAEISGPAVGGILAERLGYEMTFLLAGGTLCLSVVAGLWILPAGRPDTDKISQMLETGTEAEVASVPDAPRLLRNVRFVMLQLCYAVPAKVVLTGALFLVVPLAIIEIGATTADAGRVIMLYGLVILLTTTWLAQVADQRDWASHWVYTGGMIAGVGLCLPVFAPTMPVMAISVAVLGFGQAMSIPSQLTYVLRVSAPQAARHGTGQVLGLYRFFERFGSLAGAMVGAGLIAVLSPVEALMALGAYSLIASSIGAAYFLAVGGQDEEESIDALLVED